MSQLTLYLPDNVAADLAEAGRQTNQTPEQVAEDMLKRMIALRQFKRLSQDIRQALGPDAPRSEEEIFEQIS